MQLANDIEAETEAAIELQAATSKVSEKKKKKKRERAANAEVGQRSTASIDQVRAADVIASEMQANAMIAHYLPSEPKPK